METIKASNYLGHTGHDFSDYHIQTAERIYSLIADGNLRELGQLVNSFKDKTEGEFVHYAFLDKYEFGWEKKIHKMTKSYEELKRYGLI